MLVKTFGDESPLCPLDHGPVSSNQHAEHVRTLNAFYEKLPKDEFGEMVAPGGDAYNAAANEDRRMRLFIHRAGSSEGAPRLSITTCYWQCPTCFFVLPAIATELQR